MKRTSFASGLIFPALLAILPACDDDAPCIALQLECRGVCVDVMADPSNCGDCGHTCGTGESCVAAACQVDCAPPQLQCSGVCTDITTPANCGDCGVACAAHGTCVAGQCQNPLALLQTTYLDGSVGRDLYLLEDRSFELTQINPTSFTTDTVLDHAILPNGDVLLVAAQDTEGVSELYRVSPRGGALTKISGPMVAGGNVEPGLVVSADGTKVLYRADAEVTDEIDLYQVTLAQPGVAVRVNGATVEGGNVTRVVALSDDGHRVAYVADQDQDDLFEAYTVDLSAATPGPSVRLGPGGLPIWDLKLSRDGTTVVVRVAFGPLIGVTKIATPGVLEQVNNSDGGEGYVEDYQLADDGSAVFYTYAPNFLQDSLWTAPLAGPPYDSTRLIEGGNGATVRGDFVVSADHTQVFFRQSDATGSIQRMYRTDVATPGSRTLLSSDADTSDAEVTDFTLSHDEHSLVFRGGADGAEGGNPQPHTNPPQFGGYAPALYHVDLSTVTPGAPVLLTPPLGKQEGIGDGYLVTDDRRVLFRGDFDQATFSDAYLATVATAGTIRKVSPPLDQSTDATDVSLMTLFE